MANFKLFNYEKPGQGIDKDAPQKKRFFLFFELLFRKFWKLIQINLLFLLCCVPIITIGPAIAGLTYVLRNFSWEKPVFLASDFFEAFKKNFKQSFIVSIFDALATFIIGYSTIFYYNMIDHGVLFFILFVIAITFCIFFIFMHFYVYLMIVSNDLKILQIFKNALILSTVGMVTNFITSFFLVLCIAIMYLFFPLSIYLAIFIMPAFMGFIICFNSFPYILKYVSDPYYKKLEESGVEEEKPEPIFKDIGSKEVPLQAEKNGKVKKIK